MTDTQNELTIDRIFNASAETLWQAWTDPDLIKQWLAPRGFRIPIAEGDVRDGGHWQESMVAPDGKQMHLSGVYREVKQPEHLVFTHAWDNDNGKPGHETTVDITFTPNGDITGMHFRQGQFTSKEERDGHAGGWKECFDKLEDMLTE